MPDMAGLVRRCRAQQTPSLSPGLPSGSATSATTLFQLDIELVDNRLLLRIIASDVDGFTGKVAARAFILFCFDEAGDRLRSHSYVKEHSSGVAEDKMRWGISERLAGSNEREPNPLRAHQRSYDRTEKAK
jgi:hypothetical protein